MLIAKVYHLIWKYYNRLIFKVKCNKIGNNLWAINRVLLQNNGGYISIGDNCSIISQSTTYNPIVSNVSTSIAVNPGAELYIGNSVGISSTFIWSHKSIIIGDRATIGAMCLIVDSDCHSLNYKDRGTKRDLEHKKDSPIVIGEDTLIGTRTIIMKGVTIGARSVIGAGSVVTKDIPSDCIACGNPCKVIKQLKI